MRLEFTRSMSRLKKKLLIYFILIAIVSISVSAEIILEVSSRRFQNKISDNFYLQLKGKIPDKQIIDLKKSTEPDLIYAPIYNLRNRMLLFLLVVSLSIIGSFFMFAKDIISPMEGIVEATKKIAKGDLTMSVPVMSEDEIGQIANLINVMNMNLQDLIFQVKQEVNRYKEKISIVSVKIDNLISADVTGKIIERKKMRISDFKRMLAIGSEIVGLLDIMTNDLSSLQTYINVYKTYTIGSEISQEEIEEAMKDFQTEKSY